MQIIPGSELRCIWNGKGVSMKPTTPSMMAPGDPQDARVYFVMNGTNSTYGPEGMRSGNIAQRVCGLIPIVPPLITVSSYPAVGDHPKEPMYNPYTPASTSPTHMSMHSHALLYGSGPARASYVPNPIRSSYSHSPIPPNVNLIPGWDGLWKR